MENTEKNDNLINSILSFSSSSSEEQNSKEFEVKIISYNLNIFQIFICPNGETYDKAFKLTITPTINTYKRLKEDIIYNQKLSKSLEDKMIIYNYKGLEIDDTDISILKNNDILFFENKNKPFSTENYINEYQKIEYIKEGGYGKG